MMLWPSQLHSGCSTNEFLFLRLLNRGVIFRRLHPALRVLLLRRGHLII